MNVMLKYYERWLKTSFFAPLAVDILASQWNTLATSYHSMKLLTLNTALSVVLQVCNLHNEAHF